MRAPPHKATQGFRDQRQGAGSDHPALDEPSQGLDFPVAVRMFSVGADAAIWKAK